MPHISQIVNGNGQITISPSTDPPENTVVTVRAIPFEGEVVADWYFEEYVNGAWSWIGVSEVEHNIWRFRIEQYDVRVNMLFTSRYDPPPEPPEPPQPQPYTPAWLIAIINKKMKRRFKDG